MWELAQALCMQASGLAGRAPASTSSRPPKSSLKLGMSASGPAASLRLGDLPFKLRLSPSELGIEL
jgi:hypothetical protein